MIKGVSTSRLKNLFLLTASVVTAILVSYTGPIGFLDLVVPHIARRSFPQRHKVLLPLSAVMGGALLVLSDTLSRSVVAPAEIPVGILTTLFGVPFLVVVLLKKK
ncbi:MAG: Hemin transport system permease protein HmuU [Candidatus Aminicenantes bacterium ADurb.Bin508]|nr:MAG: Hemin transport system permease protein HmuU [Candidatus Aminicenantes bacterium ADurb.Bin508]